MELLDGDGHAEELEAALCAAYAPRDPIREFWQRKISLRALHALIIHMPLDNVFYRALAGDGWSESEWLLHDLGDMLRDIQLTITQCAPFVERPLEEEDIRPRTRPPAVVAAESKRERLSVNSKALHAQERNELMALVAGGQPKN